MIAILSAVLLLSSAPAPKAAVTHWGSEQTLTAEPKPLATAIAETKSGSTVLVAAKAESVCQKKGCWVVLRDGDASVRVTMKDYGFFLPSDVAGKTLVIEGVLAETVTTEKDQRHYAKDAGKSKAEIAAIKGELKAWSLVASSIRVQE
jgi:hypothetical protein